MGLQLTLDAADRLDALLGEAGGGPVHFRDAARVLVRAARVPDVVARRLVDEVVRADARLQWRSADEVGRPGEAPARLLEEAAFCIFDLETTGMRPTADRIVEIGAVRVVALEAAGSFERLVDPGVPIPPAVQRLTGIGDRTVRGRGPLGPALDAFVRFAGDACLVAHNARFDVGFLDAALRRRHGRRSAAPVVDTVALARALLPAHRGRFSLAALADRFDTSVTPCHRALPDAQATAELLLALVGLAQERGAGTVDDLVRLCRPPARQAHDRRRLAEGAPRAPGTYVMRDAAGQALYVGTAGDLRRRTQGYFRGGLQPRGVERALGRVERLDYAETGSAFEARLDEIGLILDLRPTGNRRGVRPERSAFLRLAGTVPRLSVSATGALPRPADEKPLPGLDPPDVRVGPLGRRSDVEQVAAALRLAYGLRSCRGARPVEGTCLQGRLGRCLAPCRGGTDAAAHDAAAGAVRSLLASGGTVPVDRLRERRRKLVAAQRFEEAAAVRDLETALRRAGRTLAALRRARSRHGVVLAAHRDPRLVAAFVVAWGVVVERRGLPRVGGAELEVSSLLSTLRRAAAATGGLDGADAARRHDELLHVDATFDRPAAGVVPLTVTREELLADADHGFGGRVAEARVRVPPPVTARAAATNASTRGGPAASRAGQGPDSVEAANGRPRTRHGVGRAEASSADRSWEAVELPL